MSAKVAQIWRHPIKSHGREALNTVTLIPGQAMPWDRFWAVKHDAAKVDGSEWAPCANFSIGSKNRTLQGIQAKLDETTGRVNLSHPDLPQLDFAPDTDSPAFLEWVHPLLKPDKPKPVRIVRIGARGMTDTDYPSISLNSLASHKELERKCGQALSPLRWRGNFLLDGLQPWVEFDWIARRLRIGAAEVVIRERIKRCRATTANPKTGREDIDTLDLLKSGWGHTDFGVYAEVIKTGQVAVGDRIEIL